MFRRKAKPPWYRCELQMCDCRDPVTYEKLPDHIVWLIHERDWHTGQQTSRARRAEDLLNAEISFLLGDDPHLRTVEALRDAQHRVRSFWADRISNVPYEEDYRVASPDSPPLRALGALR